MRIYIDLWIRVLNDKIVSLLKKLGYKAIAYEGEINTGVNDLIIVEKKVIRISNKKELRNTLRGIKRNKVIVSVIPLSTEVARMAAHDTRVDTIIINYESYKYIDKHQLNLMKIHCKPLELPLSQFLKYKPSIRSMIYRRIKYYFIHTKQPIIVSSYACSWNDILIPKSTVYLLSHLFDINSRQSLLLITTYPREILTRNGVIL